MESQCIWFSSTPYLIFTSPRLWSMAWLPMSLTRILLPNDWFSLWQMDWELTSFLNHWKMVNPQHLTSGNNIHNALFRKNLGITSISKWNYVHVLFYIFKLKIPIHNWKNRITVDEISNTYNCQWDYWGIWNCFIMCVLGQWLKLKEFGVCPIPGYLLSHARDMWLS